MMKQALYVLMGVLAGFILAGALLYVMRAPAGEPIALEPAPTERPIAVHIVGAVPRPGLYEFPDGARIQDAIDAAGGLLAVADESSLNLAAPLTDGQQLNIPFKAGAELTPAVFSTPAVEAEFPTPASDTSQDLVNLNTATVEELDALPGIGPTTAQKIIDYREENGPFIDIEEIMQVSGIGLSTFENIKDLITV